MSYVELCDQHGQYHGDYCGECVEATQVELESYRSQLLVQTERVLAAERERDRFWAEYKEKLEENFQLSEALIAIANCPSELSDKRATKCHYLAVEALSKRVKVCNCAASRCYHEKTCASLVESKGEQQ